MPTRLLSCLLLALALSAPRDLPAAVVTFGTGSLIIPMDTSTDGQNNGMLRAYGLVYHLLRHGVPVSWVIDPAKGVNGTDFTVAASGNLQDVRTGATIAARSYRGGPFLIAAANAAAAFPLIQAWQAPLADQTAVHKIIGSMSVSQDVAKPLIAAPRIAILKDGNETIAFNNLNAAGITDALDNAWSSSSPNLLTEQDVEGPTTTTDDDGALFTSDHLPRFCFLASMHYNTTAHTDEVVQEVRQWLDRSDLLHGYMQCEAARVFENALGGLYLTNAGLDDDGNATTDPAIRVPSSPFAQLDGTFEVDSGSVDSMHAKPGGYKAGVTTLINDNASTLLERITMMTGRLDGQLTSGRVTYLAGHDYTLDLPITSNPQTNGIRLFLNALLMSDCASTHVQDDVVLTKTAPASTNASEIPYTITYSNPTTSGRDVEDIEITDKLPAGTTLVAGSATPAETSNAGGVVTWNLPPLAPGEQGTVTFRVTVTSDGTYSNTARITFSHVTLGIIPSAPAVTVRDTTPPSVTIIAGPSGQTADRTPTFQFTGSADAVSFQCRIGSGPFLPCDPAPADFTSPTALADGQHVFEVRAVDAAGNPGSDTRAFEVVDDADGDGYFPPDDCDDSSAAIHPGAVETVGDGIDENCDGQELCFTDADDDGARLATIVVSADADCDDAFEGKTGDPLDCDDGNAAVHPGAQEVCDPSNVDEDCNGFADDADPSAVGKTPRYVDADGDGYGAGSATVRCHGGVANGSDCDDADPAVHPGAGEVCDDAIDNDCNTQADCADAACNADAACGASLCATGPFTCKAPGVAQLTLANGGTDAHDKLTFRWTLGDPTTAAELGDPSATTSYALCIWDDIAGVPHLVAEAIAPPAGNCVGRPCWRSINRGTGFRYEDPGLLPDGLRHLLIRSGPLGRSKIVLKGQGATLPDPPMPFQQSPRITVQLVNSLGNCWGVEYTTPAKVNTAGRLVLKERP
jgi:uncharacterized repeat protein (TIGR01451 family)